MNELRGTQNGAGLRVAIVHSRYNASVTDRLLGEASAELRRLGVADDAIDVISVPGAWEIAGAAKGAVDRGVYHAVICVGAVVRGDTPHFDYICDGATRGLMQLALSAGIPITFGVLTTDTMAQALERAQPEGAVGNKGRDCARVAVEMATLYRALGR